MLARPTLLSLMAIAAAPAMPQASDPLTTPNVSEQAAETLPPPPPAAVEIHETSMAGDVMQMRMVESVPLVSGEDVEFASGGLHVMLVGLKEEAKVRDMVEVVLHFKNSEDIVLHVPVQEGADEHGGHDG